MKTLCASVLSFEAIVVLLAIPVAVVVQGVSPAAGISVGLAIVVGCIVLAGMQRRSWGVLAGWLMQVIIILTGFVVPTMFFLGGIFALIWFYCIRVGRRGDAIKAARDAEVQAKEAAQAADAAAKPAT